MRKNVIIFLGLILISHTGCSQSNKNKRATFTMKELISLYEMPLKEKGKFMKTKDFSKETINYYSRKEQCTIEFDTSAFLTKQNVLSWTLFQDYESDYESDYERCWYEMHSLGTKLENSQVINYTNSDKKYQSYTLRLRKGEHVFKVNSIKNETIYVVFTDAALRGLPIIGIMKANQIEDFLY